MIGTGKSKVQRALAIVRTGVRQPLMIDRAPHEISMFIFARSPIDIFDELLTIWRRDGGNLLHDALLLVDWPRKNDLKLPEA